MNLRSRLVSIACALALAARVEAGEVSVKSLSGPPEEFFAQRLPTADETAVPTSILVVDRQTRARAGDPEVKAVMPPGGTYETFGTSAGVGFSVVQATTVYPYFAPATLYAPDGRQYSFDGSTIRCDFGDCGEFTADIQMEPLSGSAGIAVFSISGGEVPEGVWGLEVQDPTPIPVLNGLAPQVETLISFDDNVVDVEVDPDPCSGGRICAFAPRNSGFDLVEGAAPVLKVSFATKEMKSRGLESGLHLQSLGVTVIDTRTRRPFYQENLTATRLAALPTAPSGATLVQLPALAAGEYTVRLDIRGQVPGRGRIDRTALYFLPILARSYEPTGGVTTLKLDEQRLVLQVEIHSRIATSPHVFAYAEVWSGDGGKPIAWIGGMTQPERDHAGRTVLPLVLDARWLAKAGFVGPDFLLRNLRLQDADTFIPIAQRKELAFAVTDLPAAATSKVEIENDSTLLMGKGDRVIHVPDSATSGVVRGGSTQTGIFLVHGWCSNPVWPTWHFGRPGRVGGTEVFSDPSTSRSHDAFAREIRDQGAALFIDSFTVVAHSQGGAAATHLRSFYNSLLDLSNAPRRIQTMGTPYGGSTLMDYYLATGPLGWIIATIFGQCTQVFDLGTLGSALWSSSIPGWARNDVWYYRTGYRRARTFWEKLQFWRWRCNLASFVIPGWDDGVVADWQGLFGGAHNMGITESECHTSGMNHPAQTANYNRNDILDREGRPQSVNLARLASATASSSFTPGCSPGLHCYFPSRVNDGDRSTTLGGWTSWANNGGVAMPQWVQLDWSSPITFTRVNLWLTQGYELRDFRIEYQPVGTSSWVPIANVSGNSASVLGPYNTAPTSTQRIRVLTLYGSAAQPGYARVNEIEVY